MSQQETLILTTIQDMDLLNDLAANDTLGSVQLSRDPRESLHSIAAWPFD